MIFKRKIYDDLLNWKNKTNGKKAILIEGARRIGKSTIVEEFAKNEYESYLLINFVSASEEVKSYFDKYLNDLDTFFMYLQAAYPVTLKRRKSLIIFDEIQFFPKARQAIKFLVQDGRFDYIETGSLISIKENVKDILIPSEERHLKMYPLDFEEFLWANNESMLCELIKNSFKSMTPLNKGMHEKAMSLFKQYILVGGMPQSINGFLENNRSFIESDVEKNDILALYNDDINKINATYISKVLSIYNQIPSSLSKHEKRIIFKDIDPKARADSYEETFFWLSDSQITNECFLCNDPSVLLSLNENRAYIKCYMGDTGLLVTHAINNNIVNIDDVYRDILLGNVDLNNGMFYENVIAQILVSKGHKLYFYTHYSVEKHRNDIEVDFIINSPVASKIIPIEVKSGTRYQTRSLDKFIEKFKDRTDKAYVIHPRNLSIKENGIICIPAYMAFCL